VRLVGAAYRSASPFPCLKLIKGGCARFADPCRGASSPSSLQWAPRVRRLAGRAATTHVLFNNCYRDYAQVNAQQLAALLQD
jgi:Protein of unknown function DUF72